MKTLLLLLLLTPSLYALEIHSIEISQISPKIINISLNTEATELYYFHSWQYSVSNQTLTVQASFVSGFGSSIAYLNNNFEIPANDLNAEEILLEVKIYYANQQQFFNPENLQDQWTTRFSLPLSQTINLENNTEFTHENAAWLPNPTTGLVFFNQRISSVAVYDTRGKMIQNKNNETQVVDVSDFPDGIYYIKYLQKNKSSTIRVILKK